MLVCYVSINKLVRSVSQLVMIWSVIFQVLHCPGPVFSVAPDEALLPVYIAGVALSLRLCSAVQVDVIADGVCFGCSCSLCSADTETFLSPHSDCIATGQTSAFFRASSYGRKGRQVRKWLYRGARVVINGSAVLVLSLCSLFLGWFSNVVVRVSDL